ncbi:hypothetical protein F3Y22_tig00110013pilonHSYRG00236 [Hibiscus syriacus]|uniref:Uncharacterized protein n=1 Tax=Hibiscus syriacus TaxID=106335 RepID=A0A6A3BSN8_HIBSY|nr:hypothetical protein F3Y22_tig00110013pilonHSYRG00236 [Hibiscus syriacus]
MPCNGNNQMMTARLPFFPVEVPMAVAGGASQCFDGTLFTARHELAAPIGGISSHGRRMVLQAHGTSPFLVGHMVFGQGESAIGKDLGC